MNVTKQNLVDGLRALGIEPGMKLMVHSSLSSFGRVAGGAQTVIDALQELITPAGSLMMPSFNHGSVFEPGQPGVYDPLSSPTTNGAIPQLFWQSPGVSRSLNPTHAFACWGDDCRLYLKNHHRTLTLGPGSPLGLLAHDGGYGLLLGVGYEANTLHHVAEYLNDAPCLGFRTRSYPVRLPDRRIVEGRSWSFRSAQCPITDATRYAQLMQDRGLQRTTLIGHSLIIFFKLQECLDLILELLQQGIDDSPPCRQCPIRPNFKEPFINSDWDRATNTLLPTSATRAY